MIEEQCKAWCARFDVLVWRVERGEHKLVTGLGAMSDEAVALARLLPQDARKPLMDRLVHAERVLRTSQSEIALRIEELPSQRRAARRYVATPQLRPR